MNKITIPDLKILDLHNFNNMPALVRALSTFRASSYDPTTITSPEDPSKVIKQILSGIPPLKYMSHYIPCGDVFLLKQVEKSDTLEYWKCLFLHPTHGFCAAVIFNKSLAKV
jgi:hypothetical protein